MNKAWLLINMIMGQSCQGNNNLLLLLILSRCQCLVSNNLIQQTLYPNTNKSMIRKREITRFKSIKIRDKSMKKRKKDMKKRCKRNSEAMIRECHNLSITKILAAHKNGKTMPNKDIREENSIKNYGFLRSEERRVGKECRL